MLVSCLEVASGQSNGDKTEKDTLKEMHDVDMMDCSGDSRYAHAMGLCLVGEKSNGAATIASRLWMTGDGLVILKSLDKEFAVL